jgi:hypothetical protein
MLLIKSKRVAHYGSLQAFLQIKGIGLFLLTLPAHFAKKLSYEAELTENLSFLPANLMQPGSFCHFST